MSKELSGRIVDFIGKLLPLYVGEMRNGVSCARSLADGTLILPTEEDEDNENGFVEIHWQGDASRSSIVQGVFVASVAVARYIELHAIADDEHRKDEFQHLSNHFVVKTGESLVFDVQDPDSELYKLIGKVAEKLGAAAAIEMLKKVAGF